MVRDLIRNLQRMLLVPLVLLLAGAGAAWADPPGRVGRLSMIDGELAVRRADTQQWESAGVNWPVTEGDSLATERNSRAEIRVGSSVLRLDENTSVQVRRLDDERIRVRLDDGSVAMRVRSSDREDAIEVETRDGIATTTEPGRYRIDQVDGQTVITSYRGHVDFRAPDRHIGVSDDRRAEISTDGRTDVHWSSPDEDDFADWVEARDERDDRIGRPRHVSPEMTGYEDLYEHGDWRDYDDYGSVWFPRAVPAGWAPYRYGHWVMVRPWGWTWVDDAPWGFAPFHYGRWVLIRGRWAWVPGRYIARPVYAPALVAWIGTPGASVTISSGAFRDVSWYPLAPREVFVPYYRYSPTYVRQVNITQVTKVTEITRVVEAPDRVHHVYRRERFAVTPGSERVVKPPRVVNVDPDRLREQRRADWERRHGDERRRDHDRGGREVFRTQDPATGGTAIPPAVRERPQQERPVRRITREELEAETDRGNVRHPAAIDRRDQEGERPVRRITREELEAETDRGNARHPAAIDRRDQQDVPRQQRERFEREQAEQQREQARRAEAEQRQRERERQQQSDQEQERRRQALQQREQAEQQRDQARRAEAEQRQRQQQMEQEQDRRRQAQQQREQFERQRESVQQREQLERQRESVQQREQLERQRERAAQERAMQERAREAQQMQQQRQQQGRAEEEQRRRRPPQGPETLNRPDN